MEPHYSINYARLTLFIFLFITSIVNASTLPSGFAEVRLLTGLDPTAIELAPDGRLFVVIKSGKVLVYKNNALLSTPLLNLTVDKTNERGLQSITLDPNFSSNGFFYAYYTVSGANHNRVSRFTASGDVASTSSELILLDMDVLKGSVHNGGTLFFKDGKLFITTGEGSDGPKAQSFTSLLGKVLRINPNGTIPSDNPFLSTTSGKYQAIYALGFRNPFKATVQRTTGRVFVNDVGAGTWEEINDLIAGKNYGWPTIEGVKTTQTAPANYVDPVFAYGRSSGCSITGGAFYNPVSGQFPSTYVGKYFFQDYCSNYIKVLDLSSFTVQETFATGLDRPIDIEVSSDGSLYYISRGGIGGGSQQDNESSNEGEVWKVNYTASGQPTISAQPTNKTVSVGGSTSFVVGASGNGPLSYQWQKNNVNISGATSSTYTISSAALADNGAIFRVIVSNSLGSVTSNGATLTVLNDALPVPVITLPTDGTKYSAGQVINFAGTATDAEDGELPASAFTWEVRFYHDEHFHPALEATTGSKSGSYTVPTFGETSSNVWYRIILTVKDSKGQSNQVSRDVLPNKATITLATTPAGLSVKLDGTSYTTPYVFTGVVGIVREIEAVTPQVLNTVSYQFTGWSDSGTAQHQISTPSVNTTYTASYSTTSTANAIPGKVQAENFSAMSGVQTENTGDTGAGLNVGWIDTGDWMDYTVNVATAGTYTINYRVASQAGGGKITLRQGTTDYHTVNIPSTGGWQTWTTVSASATLTAGVQTLRVYAAASGFNLNWFEGVAATANVLPTVSITSPANNATFTAGSNISINANASDTDGTITKVEFYQGSTKLGEDTSSPYSYTWNGVIAGTYSLTAIATDNGGATKTSSAVSVTVGPVSTLRDPENPANAVNGLDYSYYQGNWSMLPDFSAFTAVKTGTVTTFDLTPRTQNDQFAFKYTGYVNVATDGTYTFYTTSDDGSKLYIGTTQVVNNDGLHGNVEVSGMIGLKAGKHAITVTFFEQGGGESLSVSYAGPSLTKTVIPASALYRVSGVVAPPSAVVHAINAGGPAFTATDGTVYSADTRFSGGTTFTSGNTISNTTDGALYQSERYGNFTYALPVTTSGNYDVTFKLSENYFSASSRRVFDVKAEGNTVISALDIFVAAGAQNRAYDVVKTVSVTDGVLNLEFVTIADNAKIGALLVKNNSITRVSTIDEESDSETLAVYPNPATNTLNISAKDIKRVIVYNLQGVAVIKPTGNYHTLDISAIPAGMYLLKVKTSKAVHTRKFLKQ